MGTYRGLKQISHTGSWVGFTTHYLRFPERRVSIVALCNSNVITAGVGGEIRDLVLDQLDAEATIEAGLGHISSALSKLD